MSTKMSGFEVRVSRRWAFAVSLSLALTACEVEVRSPLKRSTYSSQEPLPSMIPNPVTLPNPLPNESPIPTPSPTPSPTPVPTSPCDMVPETIRLKQGAYTFPRSGNFVTESHYAVKEETFGKEKRLFPNDVKEEIEAHLEASCRFLKENYDFKGDLNKDCSNLYNNWWDRQWTPAEGGGVPGQGSKGNLKPSREQELWQGNLMYASGATPSAGTKYILTNPSSRKSVVVSFGYEVGPGDPTWLGGLTTEVQFALENRAPATTSLVMGRAKDQSIPYGPIDCSDEGLLQE